MQRPSQRRTVAEPLPNRAAPVTMVRRRTSAGVPARSQTLTLPDVTALIQALLSKPRLGPNPEMLQNVMHCAAHKRAGGGAGIRQFDMHNHQSTQNRR